jgi:hypothetical protein
MPIFECDCGLIISTSSERTQCLRCHHSLGQAHRLRRVDSVGVADTVVISIQTRRVLYSTSSQTGAAAQSARNQTVG